MIGCRTYAGLCPHLQGLWRYACDNFRLFKSKSRLDPFWTLIFQDAKVQVEADPLIDRTGTAATTRPHWGFSGKNCEMFLGQFVSLIARERVNIKKGY